MRFRRDEWYGAQCWMAFFRGRNSVEAEVAAREWHKLSALLIAYVEAHKVKR